MLTDHIKPAAVRAGIGKVGWHTFRHTFSSLLTRAGPSVPYERSCYSTLISRLTMHIYTQAVSEEGSRRAGRAVLLKK
jgi:integrase